MSEQGFSEEFIDFEINNYLENKCKSIDTEEKIKIGKDLKE
ncbi:hypothetical protein ACTFIN_08365 [Clostridium cagae]|nr:hypothetical protein [uncultured Clostridium sp.]